MEEVKYIPGDLVMTDGAPIGTKKGVVYVVTASDPNRTLTLKDGIVNKGVVTLDAVTEEDKAYFAETSTWVKHIVPIPLTPQILENNGWEWMSNEYRPDSLYYPSDDIKIDIECTKEFGCYVYFEYAYENTISLKYIHELQHLLFGLGLPSDLKV